MAGTLVVDTIESGSGVSQGTNPTGTVIMYYGAVPPTGYLECNGQSTSGFDDLETLIGSNTPDLRGEFVRGWDNGAGVDTGRALGSSQAATSTRQAMNDAFGSDSNVTSPTFNIGQQYAEADGNQLTGTRLQSNGGVANSTQDNVSRGAQDNAAPNVDNWISYRPRNVALMYCIKT
ncbi:tail collar fiber protein [Synechococcus phage S-CAM7]|uniref:Tail fiber protein n=1 Tax=Synechococcus phage S-CAM7 TaxID=1883368 RepID=A0A1D8KUJ6_9CAUD|nr:tail collar fiber protein [Synechococcus phage S-CAM7]AOV61968.1 tail fiber protein [Synechococcus phage S-CAM7]AOV62234.1 tail fiber protein [Synechococcus phage S-CAM7]QLF86095.1 hypothetical protein CC030809_00039 [Synechococcus phage S-CAM7]